MILASAGGARASLGGPADSVASDIKVFSAQRGATTAVNGYTIHEMIMGGTTVREYVSASGIVFGIAWNGLMHPDLTQLLGSYAGQYEAALKGTAPRPGSRQFAVRTDGVTVEKWGRVRDFHGRAYAPALIPAGVSVDEIK
jgi:hypothetical protein